jgi:hypothetical protein
MQTFVLTVAKALAKAAAGLVGLSSWIDDKRGPEPQCVCNSRCCTHEERKLRHANRRLRYLKTREDLSEVLAKMARALEDT